MSTTHTLAIRAAAALVAGMALSTLACGLAGNYNRSPGPPLLI